MVWCNTNPIKYIYIYIYIYIYECGFYVVVEFLIKCVVRKDECEVKS